MSHLSGALRYGVYNTAPLKWRMAFKVLIRKDLILVHAVHLKPTIKVQISGRLASIGISDVVTVSVYSEKTLMKKLMR